MRPIRLICVFFILVSWHSSSSADDYYWMVFANTGSSLYPDRFPTPSSACMFLAQKSTTSSKSYEFTGLVRKADYDYYCQMIITTNGVAAPPANSGRAIRRGDTCQFDIDETGSCVAPSGDSGAECEGPDFFGMPSIYNSAGQCVPWNEADKAANCKHMASSGSQPTKIWVSFDGDGNPENPTVEKLGCEAVAVSTAHCKMPVPKCGQGICVQTYVSKCEVHVNFTGDVAGDSNNPFPVSTGPGEEGVCPEGVDCTPKPEPVVEESKPCNYMYNGQVVQCESSEFKGDPGEMNCGRVNNGPYTCTKKVPQSNGIDIKTKITTEPTADGGTKTTKEDEHTKTVCSAPGSCTTQVTNNKTVIVKDSSGKTVSESGECTGALCDGKGNGKTPSKGGNCQPGEECGTEEEGGSFSGPENGEVPGFGESLQSFKDKVAGAPIIAGISAIQMPAGGSCNMSSASTMIGTISGDTVCQNSGWLDPLYYVFLAMGALNAVRILMSA